MRTCMCFVICSSLLTRIRIRNINFIINSVLLQSRSRQISKSECELNKLAQIASNREEARDEQPPVHPHRMYRVHTMNNNKLRLWSFPRGNYNFGRYLFGNTHKIHCLILVYKCVKIVLLRTTIFVLCLCVFFTLEVLFPFFFYSCRSLLSLWLFAPFCPHLSWAKKKRKIGISRWLKFMMSFLAFIAAKQKTSTRTDRNSYTMVLFWTMTIMSHSDRPCVFCRFDILFHPKVLAAWCTLMSFGVRKFLVIVAKTHHSWTTREKQIKDVSSQSSMLSHSHISDQRIKEKEHNEHDVSLWVSVSHCGWRSFVESCDGAVNNKKPSQRHYHCHNFYCYCFL